MLVSKACAYADLNAKIIEINMERWMVLTIDFASVIEKSC